MLTKNHIEEVILHVGLTKTGSSSIQATLYNKDNNEVLLKEGILYPRCWEQKHDRALCRAFSSNPEKFAMNKFPKILSKEEIKHISNINLEKFEGTLNNNVAKRLVISGEEIPKLSGKDIKKMKDYLMDIGLSKARFKIMIYTRNPITWSVSAIQQRFKDGTPYGSILNKLKNDELPAQFQDKIGKFVDVFGEDAVHVYSFEEAKNHDFGIVGHFLEELDVDRKIINTLNQFRNNESISMFTGMFLAYANERIPLLINGKLNKKRRRKDHIPLQSVRGDKFDISLQEKKKIQSVAMDDIEWLNENYHINYSHEVIVDKKRYKNMGISIQDVERIYPALTKTLRDVLVEFMENRLMTEIPSQYKTQCNQLIQRLKGIEEDLIRVDQGETRFQTKLNVKQTDEGLMYRELALLMEGYGQVDAAKMFMKKARLYSPNGELINNKLEEYTEELRQDSTEKNKKVGRTSPDMNPRKYALLSIGVMASALGILSLLRRID